MKSLTMDPAQPLALRIDSTERDAMTKMPETTTGWKTKSHQFSLHGILKLATSGRQPGFVASPVGGDSTSGRGGPIGGKNTRAGHGSIQTRDRPFPERDHRQTS